MLMRISLLERTVKLARTRIAALFQFMRYLVVSATANSTEASASAIAAQTRIASLKPSPHGTLALIDMLTSAATAHTRNPLAAAPTGKKETNKQSRYLFICTCLHLGVIPCERPKDFRPGFLL
jgi:hypothetical protein